MILIISNSGSGFSPEGHTGTDGSEFLTIRNNEYDVEGILSLEPDRIVLGPGSCAPAEAGVCLDLVRRLAEDETLRIPVLGVGLGCLIVCEAFGNSIEGSQWITPQSAVDVVLDTESVLFEDMEPSLHAICTHGPMLPAEDPVAPLLCTARTATGEFMAVEHRELPIYGVLFHPEAPILERFLA